MNPELDRIHRYIEEVERHLLGDADARASVRQELSELLSDAAEAGELEASLQRLGAPEQAAKSFTRDRWRPLAPVSDRLVAAAIDNLPLIGVALGLFVQGLREGAATLTFPPFAYFQLAGGCVALVPPCGVYNGGWLHALGLPVALVWSIIILGLLESWRGQTPGKYIMGLRVVTEEGLRIRPHTGFMRRLSFLLGPFAWLDWTPALWGDRQRVLDKVNATKVILATAAASQETDTVIYERTP